MFETVLWFLVWLAIGCLIFYIAFRILPKIFGSSAEMLKFANIALGVIALIALAWYCYYYFPGGSGSHTLFLKH